MIGGGDVAARQGGTSTTTKFDTLGQYMMQQADKAEGLRNQVHAMLERLRGPVPTPTEPPGKLAAERRRATAEVLSDACDRIANAQEQTQNLLNELSTFI